MQSAALAEVMEGTNESNVLEIRFIVRLCGYEVIISVLQCKKTGLYNVVDTVSTWGHCSM